MLVPMTQLEVVGLADHLDQHVRTLQRLRAVEPVDDQVADHETDATERELLQRLDALLALSPTTAGVTSSALDVAPRPDPAELIAVLEDAIREPVRRATELRAELDTLPRTVASLEAVVPLVPELRDLTDTDLSALRLATVMLVLDDPEGVVRDEINAQLAELLGASYLMATAAAGGSVGCLIVVAAAALSDVQALLGRDQVTPVHLAGRYAGKSLSTTVTQMRVRQGALPGLIERVEAQLIGTIDAYRAELLSARAELIRVLERRAVARVALRGRTTYAVRLWTPRHRFAEVASALMGSDPTTVVVELPRRQWRGTSPVLLRNTRLARPYERLIAFLAWPQAGSLDPTGLMAVVLPVLFGIMVGDVGYGLALTGIGWWVGRRYGRRSAVAADASRILVVGGMWSTVFGVLFGELFGDLGKTLFGMPALWFYRGGPDALAPLLLFVLGVGAVHLVFGLLLGVWQAVRHRHLSHVAERLGSLLVLVGLFLLAGGVTALLPRGVLTPAAAVVVVGVVLSAVPHGALGLLLGPLEAISRIGNVLSYLRLAAVGLASVYLAIVANELGRQAPLLLGILIAVLFHALNLALAAFSPMIQSMRLHYVEFFGTFYDSGGRPFRPLGADAEPESDIRITPDSATAAAAFTAEPVLVSPGR